MNTRQIQALRKKFIFVSMMSLCLAMFCIGAAIYAGTLFTYRYMIQQTLNNIADHDGKLVADDFSSDDEEKNEILPSVPDVFKITFNRYDHYFSVKYSADGEVLNVENSFAGTDEEKMAREFSGKIYSSGKVKGRYGKYYYLSETQEDGSTLVVFLDCRTELYAMSRLLYITLLICLVALAITFFLVRHFSWRVIQPEIENSHRQKQFITNASHELKTPLAVIRANTELEQMLTGENEWNQSTINQVDRMNGLIQNLVMIARAQEQEDKEQVSDIDVSKAVSESVDPYESLAKQENKTLTRNIEENIHMRADSSKIRQLTTLLVDNAIKYCDENGKISVSLSYIKRGKEIQLNVSNSYAAGKNVDYKRFFDRFYREDTSRNIDRGGYGIGLSMAESICRQYSGTINAEWKNGIISFICILS